MDNTSKVIKEIRAHLGLGQAELARELGVSFATVNRWERGHFAPSPVALKALKQLCRERGLDFQQYEENYKSESDLCLSLYGTGAEMESSLLLDSRDESLRYAESAGYLCKASLELEGAILLNLTNAVDFLFLNAFRRGVLTKQDAPERYRRCEALVKGCDVVVTYGITKDLSALITRFYKGEITDRALGACLSLYTVGQGYLLISERAKEALTVTALETVDSKNEVSDGELQTVLKKYRRDGFYFDEILDDQESR